MSEYLIQDTTLTGIADAIRGKTGGTEPVAVSDMAAQIEGIQAGGGDIDALIERSITEISSNVTSIGTYAFSDCTQLTAADFPVATSIGDYAFRNCSKLTAADFPAATSIGRYAFYDCSKLTVFVLRSEVVVTMSNKNALSNTPIASGTGYIYVPRALLSDTDETKDYRRATNWSTYAAQFRALEDYTVDGTTTGELDPTKTGT